MGATRVTPNSQAVWFQIARMLTKTIGVGGGPFLSSIAVQVSGTVGAPACSALISYVFVAPFVAFIVASMLLPADVSHLLEAKKAVDVPTEPTGEVDMPHVKGGAVALSEAVRSAVWVKGLVYN